MKTYFFQKKIVEKKAVDVVVIDVDFNWQALGWYST